MDHEHKNVIGIWWDNELTGDIDFRMVDKGNPGCGGTSYLFALLIHILVHENFKVIVYSKKPIIDEGGYFWYQSDCLNNAIVHFNSFCGKKQFILNAVYYAEISTTFLEKTTIILWHHNSVNNSCAKEIKHSKNKIINVFLTKHQKFDYYKYPRLINNSIVIPNANVSTYSLKRNLNKNIAVFMGSIVPGKNLHLLLKAWPEVTSKINATLLIVGSGQVYSKEASLGPYKIAEEQYENELITIINNLNIWNSVKFLGIKDYQQFEKEIAPIVKVGIVNPAYNTHYYGETFCLSATQIGSFGIPVVGGNLSGLKSTLPKKCGYRINNLRDLSRKIVKLLKNKRKNIKYGMNYQKYIKTSYDLEIVSKRWNDFLMGKIIIRNQYFIVIPYFLFKSFAHVIIRFFVKIKRIIVSVNKIL